MTLRQIKTTSAKPLSVAHIFVGKSQLFTLIRRSATDILVPFGDCYAQEPLKSKEIKISSFETFNSTGSLVTMEPIAEFGSKLQILKKIGSIQISGHYWSCNVLFCNEDGIVDDEESVVLLKDLLKHYPESVSNVYEQLKAYVAILEMSSNDFDSQALALSEQSPISFSPNNYMLKKQFFETKPIDFIIAPIKPCRKHPHYKMYLADFITDLSIELSELSELSAKLDNNSMEKMDETMDKKMESIKPTKQNIESEESLIHDMVKISNIEPDADLMNQITECSTQSLIDFERKINFDIQKNTDFLKSKHYIVVQNLPKLNKMGLQEEFETSKNLFIAECERIKKFTKKQKTQEKLDLQFRLKLVCEGLSILYGIGTNLDEFGIRYD
jgi:hypothetical protein